MNYTILVPTDFSDNAANALDYAAGLARFLGGRILLFHNSDVPLTYSGTNLFSAGDMALGTDPLLPGAALTNPELEKVYQEKLEKLADDFRQQAAGQVPIATQYRWGSLTDNINELVQQENVNLVVMGTRGATSFLDRLIGTNTAMVLREVHRPVLAIPTQARFTPYRQIAYAAGLEADEQVYLSQVLAFAQPFEAQISLVHVSDHEGPDGGPTEQVLAGLRSQYPGQHIQLVQLQQDDVAKGLESFALGQQADLIAVATHERSFLGNLFHSSVTEKLAYHISLPLLALPEKPYPIT